MTIHNIVDANSKLLQTGEHVVIMHARRVPPHIGLLINGVFHDLSVRGVLIDHNLDGLVETITRMQLPTLFVQIDGRNDGKAMREILDQYTVATETITCLTPLREYYNLPLAKFVFELLPKLPVLGACQFNLNNGSFELTKYSQKELQTYIASRKQKQSA